MRRSFAVGIALLAPVGCSLLIDDGDLTGGGPAPDGGTPEAANAAPDVVPTATGGGSDAGDASAVGDAGDPFVAAVLADGPLGYWRLEEETGDFFRDEVGTRSLTLIHPEHATLGKPGVRGRAINLDGNTELRIGGAGIDFPPNKLFSIECWIRPTDTADNYRRIFTKLTTGGGGPIDGTYLWVNGGRLAVGFERWRESTAVDEVYWNTRPPTSVFTHLIVVVDGVRTKLYVDGVVVDESTKAPEPAANPNVPASWGFNFAGDLDELAFYEKPLTGARVKAHFDAVRP